MYSPVMQPISQPLTRTPQKMHDAPTSNIVTSSIKSKEAYPFWRSSSEIPRVTPLSDSQQLPLADLEALPEEKIYKRSHSGRSTSFKSIIEYKLMEALLGEPVHSPEPQTKRFEPSVMLNPRAETRMTSVLSMYHGELRKHLGEKVAEMLNEPPSDDGESEYEIDANQIGGMFLNELDRTLNKVLQNGARSRPPSSRPQTSSVVQARDAIMEALKEVLSEQSIPSRRTSAKSTIGSGRLNPDDLQRAKTRLASSQALYELLDDLMDQMQFKMTSRPESVASLASTVLDFGDDPPLKGWPPQSTHVTINSQNKVMNKPRQPRSIKSAPASILKKRVSHDNVFLNTRCLFPTAHYVSFLFYWHA